MLGMHVEFKVPADRESRWTSQRRGDDVGRGGERERERARTMVGGQTADNTRVRVRVAPLLLMKTACDIKSGTEDWGFES